MYNRTARFTERTLSKDGRQEIGHIFPRGSVPVEEIVPELAYLEGEGDRYIFKIPTSALTEAELDGIYAYVIKKFGCTKEDARAEIQGNGHFPIRKEFVIESYDRRLFA